MEGNPVDPGVYVDYQGKRVYFCCTTCQAAFRKEPGKYLPRLPQFAASREETADEPHDHGEAGTSPGFSLHQLTEPLGIATISLLALTLTTGLLRRKLKRRFLTVHKTLALSAAALAALHALTVLLGH
jgi:hypothetical protein